MFKNFLKIILRKLYREKLYTLINISGLAIAIACCVILGLYLESELTYDQHFKLHDRIYRVEREFNLNGSISQYAINSHVLGPMLVEEFPEIEASVRVRDTLVKLLIRHEDQAYFWDNSFIVDDNFFRVFDHDIIYGDPETALVDPNSVAVSETFARTYFGDANPLGKIISTDEEGPRKISLVFADVPENSHFKYDVLFSYNYQGYAIPDDVTQRRQQLWGGWSHTFLLMPENYDVGDFKGINDTFYARHAEQQGRETNSSFRNWLTPLADIHLHTDLEYDEPTGNIFYVYGFTTVAVFILLVACINYMNMATARAARRARDVGLHKILGAGRRQLILQFLGEAMLFSFIATVLGVVIVELSLNMTSVTTLLDKPLTLDLFDRPLLLCALAGLFIIIGILSGIYPSFYLSSMTPDSALISRSNAGKANVRLREFLVLVQFIISVAVIACTLLMASQMRFVSEKSLGFSKDNKVVITLRGLEMIDKIPTITNELAVRSDILAISSAPGVMGRDFPTFSGQAEDNSGEMIPIFSHTMSVDEQFVEVMDIRVIDGRSFSTKFAGDQGANFMVNETTVRKMGWEEPIGKRFRLGAFDGRVIGVMEDFHFKSLHSQVEPFVLTQFVDRTRRIPADLAANPRRLLILKISGDDVFGTISYLEERFKEFNPRYPFEYEFLDDTWDRLYFSEQRLMKLVGIFSGVCIFIACLGLFGLASFTTEQRTKEIGIRKILGATTIQILILLSRSVLAIVLFGALIASVLSYYAIDEWLAGFAYRMDIDPLVFIISAAGAATVAILTLVLQSFKTAQSNPIKALRYE